MHYAKIRRGVFHSRPNRFIALVETSQGMETCHVKNTGRCRELLLPGAPVILAVSDNPARKTQSDLVAVYKGHVLINLDSQAPNQVAAEYLPHLFPGGHIRPECRHGDSRLDFCVDSPVGRTWVEVKGVTLEQDGIALFPDAPTQRGTKHLNELARCVREGEQAMALFVIQMKGPRLFRPNPEMDPAFSSALKQAGQQGVQIHAVDCLVWEQGLCADQPIPIELF